MTEFNIGDTVRVTVEGTIVDRHAGMGEEYAVSWTSADATTARVWFGVKELTLIEPPIVLPEIPGTIVQVDPLNEHHQRAVYEFDRFPEGDWWRFGYRDALNTHELIEECRQYGYRVIPAATEEVESV